MFRGLLFAAALLVAGPAVAADQPSYAPEAAWVLIHAIPVLPPPSDGLPVQVLLTDSQVRLADSGDERYYRNVTRILSAEGLNSNGQLATSWDPATETLSVHHLHILRGDKVIDVLAGDRRFLVLRRENNLEMAMLDGRLTATIQVEGLEIGDVVDIAYTKVRRDPALAGHSTRFDGLEHAGVAGRIYSRTLWTNAKPVRWRQTTGIDAPKIARTADGSEAVVDMSNAVTPKSPDRAPFRFAQVGTLEFSDFRDWSEVSSVMALLYAKAETLKPDGPLQAEIAKIAAASADPKVRATAALKLVEDKIRYLFLGLNDGGLVPADADETWARRFGDCKGKSVLLVAILRALGLDARPALVSTTAGDGLDERLPVSDWFDHAIVELQIAGKTYWLDGTRRGDLALDDLTVPNYHWALPVQPAKAALVRMAPPPLPGPTFESVARIDASKGFDTVVPIHVELIYRGELAVTARESLKSGARTDYDRSFREMLAKDYPSATFNKVDAVQEDALNQVRLIADGTGKLDLAVTSGGGHYYGVHGTAMGADIAFRREPGPNTDAPYVVHYPSYIRVVQDVTLPKAGVFTLTGIDVDAEIAGQQLKRQSRISDNVLHAEVSIRSLVPEFPAAQADAAGAAMRALPRSDVAVFYDPAATANLAAKPAAKTDSPSISNPDADLKAAQGGDAGAQLRMAKALATGQGVPMDMAQAQVWLKKAADGGSAEAQTALAEALLNNPAKTSQAADAIALLEAAAGRGYAPAEARLGRAYLIGWGVAKSPKQALAWYQKSAAQGDLGGAYELAFLYINGAEPDVPKDTAEGMKWLRTAADHGSATAQNALAYRLWNGQGVAVDLVQAMNWFEKATAQGDLMAQNNLGLMYQAGQGAPQNLKKAMELYQDASAKGHAQSMNNLALLYLNGNGVPKDTAQALAWFKKAAEAGLVKDNARVGEMYLGLNGAPADYQEAAVWLHKGADKQDPDAEYDLGNLYSLGWGVPKDGLEAALWYKKSATHGSAQAAGMLGGMYYRGDGVGVDFAQAAIWLRKSAEANDPYGLSMLGVLYANGRGVGKDSAQAVVWYQKSADQGGVQGQYNLGMAYSQGLGLAKDPAKAIALITKSAEGGFGDAQAMLGMMYMHGTNVALDNVKAALWLQKAADQGIAGAQDSLGYLYDQGLGVPQDYAKGVQWHQKAAEQGLVTAQYNLGLAYWYARGVAHDDVKGTAWFLKGADQGDAHCQTNLAFAYQEGRGVPKDAAVAAAWYRKAADQGEPIAERSIGIYYEKGLGGVPPDRQKALAWLAKASRDGDTAATKELSSVMGAF